MKKPKKPKKKYQYKDFGHSILRSDGMVFPKPEPPKP